MTSLFSRVSAYFPIKRISWLKIFFPDGVKCRLVSQSAIQNITHILIDQRFQRPGAIAWPIPIICKDDRSFLSGNGSPSFSHCFVCLRKRPVAPLLPEPPNIGGDVVREFIGKRLVIVCNYMNTCARIWYIRPGKSKENIDNSTRVLILQPSG